jgi:hypothetical protein
LTPTPTPEPTPEPTLTPEPTFLPPVPRGFIISSNGG